ncbi:MAG: plastocyanin/azurin family copper-binding protein [Acidimicrobiia bacterium]
MTYPRRRLRAALGTIAVIGGLFGAFAAIPFGQQAGAQQAPADVEIKGFYFRPDNLTVPGGTTVTWTNRDNILHTATSGKPEAPDGRFNGEMDGAGTTFSTTLNTPGVYEYFCSRHPSMVARVTVQ